MQDSVTASVVSHLSEDPYFHNKAFLTPQSARRESGGNSVSSSPYLRGLPEHREKRVMFRQGKPDTKEFTTETEKPLHERSSPVEEWSSDSRESPLLEMSRYDNVPSSGSLAKGAACLLRFIVDANEPLHFPVHRERVNRPLSTPLAFFDENNRSKTFLT
ncbi:hypothetical protein ANCCAN_17712 [Ancylostoma caninum]|uniref:Uncharacterized protein n=1 Tax=Ancylostoma caninum TaxID=29170 RepID=A0A368FWC5_ANCCA|nr:hypothetical protein ANCCAN_17712 [Ancylostoma caninum]